MLFSYYTGKLSRRHETLTGQGFCSHTRTIVAEWNYVAPISKVERHIPDRFCVNLAMWTPFGTVAEINKYERVLEPTEMEVTFKEYKILVHQTLSDNRTDTMFNMYNFWRAGTLLFILMQ